MAGRGRPGRRTTRGPESVLGLVGALLLLAGVWLTFAAPSTSAGDDPSTVPGTALHVEVSRVGDRATLDVVGRARRSSSDAPVAFRVLGRPDVAAPCPAPTVRPSSVVKPPAGSVRVGWRPVSGPRPGVALERGAVFRSRGTVAIPNDAALRLCVHLVRAGSEARVLHTERVVVPSASMMTPLSVAIDPIADAAVPWVRALLVLGVLALVVLALRRPLAALRPPVAAERALVPDESPVAGGGVARRRHGAAAIAAGAARARRAARRRAAR